MTCIVGFVDKDGKAFIGGDSCASDGLSTRATGLAKVFQRGDITIGYSSSFRMGQILEHLMGIPPRDMSDTDDSYIIGKFVEEVRNAFRDYGFMEVENNQESGEAFLIGYHGEIYLVDEDFQVNFFRDGMQAIGSGYQFALGAMLYLKAAHLRGELSGEQVVTEALRAAETFCGTVREPFTVLEVKRSDE